MTIPLTSFTLRASAHLGILLACLLCLTGHAIAAVTVNFPAYRADINGNTTISISAPGETSAVAKCWQSGSGVGQDSTVATVALDGSGNGSFVFPANSYPHGPLTVRIEAGGDICYLQLYNTGGTAWKEGLAAAPQPPQAAGLVLAFADDFDGPLSISEDGLGATYGAHMVPASKDFSRPRFRNFEDATRNPFHQRDSYLRIRATTVADETGTQAEIDAAKAANQELNGLAGTGLINSVDQNRNGFKMQIPFYMECRFVAQRATGSWPAFWALSIPNGSENWGELDVIEGYGSNSNNQYWISVHDHPTHAGNDNHKVLMDDAQIGGLPTLDWAHGPQTYGCLVTETTTTFYLNDVAVWSYPTRTEWLDQDFFFLINYAFAGQSGWLSELSRYGYQSDMYVDWVRVYTADSVSSVPASTNRWQFNGDTTDSAGSAHGALAGNADANHTADWVEGGASLALDGNGDGCSIGNSALHDEFSQYTVSVWFKPDSVTGIAELYEEGGTWNGLALRLNGSTLEARAKSGTSQVDTTLSGVTAGTWQLAVLTFDAGTLKLYLNDGSQNASTGGGPASVGSHTQPAGIGFSNGADAYTSGSGSYFSGLIDDVGIWDGTALTSQDVTNLYHEFALPTVGNLQMGSDSFAQPARGSGNEWKSVTFPTPYTTAPVVVVSSASTQGSEGCTVRVRAVSTTGFEWQIDEWDYLGGSHVSETISWMAIEPGEYELEGKSLIAGSFSDINASWKSKSFSTTFASAPVVLASVTTINETSAVTTRLRNVSASGFDVRVQEQQSGSNADGDASGSTAHANETVTFVAIESGEGSEGGFKSGVMGGVGDTWESMSFGGSYPSQLLFATMQTFNGSDPCALRHTSLTDTGVSFLSQEEASADSELNHNNESIGWLIFK